MKLVAPLLVIAAAIRIAVNNVVEFSRADEAVYVIYAKALAAGEGYRHIIALYLNDRGMWVFPHPLRWSYIGAAALFSKMFGATPQALATLSTIAGIATVIFVYWLANELFGSTAALFATTLAATSPLQLALGRRALSDEFFCAIVLGSLVALVMFLRTHRVAWLATWIVLTTLAFGAKEQFLLTYPFVLLFWWLNARRLSFTWFLPPFLYFAVFCLLAGDVTTFFRIEQITTSTIGAPYAAEFQSGPLHRLIIDSMTIAPIVTMLAIGALMVLALRRDAYPPALRYLALLATAIVVAHSLLPSRNLRYIASADPLLRIIVAAFFAIELRERPRTLAALIAINALTELRLFYVVFIRGDVYDPVSQNLFRALHMIP